MAIGVTCPAILGRSGCAALIVRSALNDWVRRPPPAHRNVGATTQLQIRKEATPPADQDAANRCE